MKLVRLFLLGLLALPGMAQPQGRFWLVDATAQFIGEVASVDSVYSWVALPGPGGEPVFVPFEAAGGVGLTAEILYESTNCSGTPYVLFGANAPAHRTGFVIEGNQLWAAKHTPTVSISAQSAYYGVGDCQSFAATLFSVHEVELVGNMTFTPPVRVVWNPNVLLLDGFELGNSSHW